MGRTILKQMILLICFDGGEEATLKVRCCLSFARKPAPRSHHHATMGRRKQHCPKRTSGDDSSEAGQSSLDREIIEARMPTRFCEGSTDRGEALTLAAKWLQLQAQFALRLRQQSETDEAHAAANNVELAQQPPLDLSSKSSSVPSSIASFASLMMDHGCTAQPHQPPPSVGMCALQRISQMASRSHIPFRFASSLNSSLMLQPCNSPAAKPFPWQQPSWLMMARSPQTQSFQQPPPPPPLPPTTSSSSPEKAAGDAFRCVWCRESFATLSQLTGHLKEAKHGEKEGSRRPQQGTPRAADRGPNPRKLVRGQDVWLGKGEEQTRQILKCMWCGQSFRSLADLTAHMSETRHYTKVIPQEQLSTWRAQQQRRASPPPDAPSPPRLSPKEVLKAPAKEKKKKAIPVRKLLEMERQASAAEVNAANDENDLSDANRSSTSILGSLERLVESSFKPAAGDFAQQVVAAKRAFATAFDSIEDEERPAKKCLGEDVEAAASPAVTWSSSSSLTSASAELKFLKYSELAKELSSGR